MSALHGLQVTTIAQEEKFSLISGKKLCTQCRKLPHLNPNESSMNNDVTGIVTGDLYQDKVLK